MTDHVKLKHIPRTYRSKAKIDKATDAKIEMLMGLCGAEPADFEGCFACYAYKVAQARETAKGPPPSVEVRLTWDELYILIEGIDAYRYWQLADEQYRHDGFVLDPGSDEPETAEQIDAATRLEQRLEALRATLPEPSRKAP